MTRRILLDCDGPLSDFDESAMRFLRPHLPEGWEPPLGTWAMQDSFHPELKQRFEDHCRSPGFCLGMKPVVGAQEAVRRLQALAGVYVVTSPFRKALHWPGERIAWLNTYFGLTDTIVITSAKYVVNGDVLVDDHFQNLMKWKEHHPTGLAVLWKARGNHPHWNDPRVLAIDNWEDEAFWLAVRLQLGTPPVKTLFEVLGG